MIKHLHTHTRVTVNPLRTSNLRTQFWCVYHLSFFFFVLFYVSFVNLPRWIGTLIAHHMLHCHPALSPASAIFFFFFHLGHKRCE
uniref:Uncharacterized protein n=1 Tax=Pyxicephalus adspersus TaxID=30357 RepID=A0AAV3B3A8_PYXAD|nr:TPA: hypothetical protein GDO54_005976 [Pyxicephalus adspersus]